jgi:hypothetical protein
MTVNSSEGCKKLQDDLVCFTKWCVDNRLGINIYVNVQGLKNYIFMII